MESSFFFMLVDAKHEDNSLISDLRSYANEKKVQTYVINRPLSDNKYTYKYTDAFVVLIPNHKLMFVDCGNGEEDFDDFYEDFLEDLGSISDKYMYKSIIDRPRVWRRQNVAEQYSLDDFILEDALDENRLVDPMQKKRSELLISLLTGSINDIERVKENVPDNILDKIKQKILLFDAEQTRFVYETIPGKKITIQGMSGTGKTELLLHKLKEIYLSSDDSKVLFTCHNKILANSLRSRIPDFFNFMKVEKQIKWNERLWCVHAWGSASDENSGAYRYICEKYGIPFKRFSYSMPFSTACSMAIEYLKKIDIESFGYAFHYVLLDESQDFPPEFLELCEMVSKEKIYVAGDIFQSIFDTEIVSEVAPDFLLSKCYRTDPRTLMFAHALCMGLFEETKLRWLEDEQWSSCGYIVNKNEDNSQYTLTREPLKRFEELESSGLASMSLIRSPDSNAQTQAMEVLSVIEEIVKENPTVQPSDIGVIFLGSNKKGFLIGDIVEHMLRQRYGWNINRAYQSKSNSSEAVFYSNKNNVKGLEFPFVICLSETINDELHERNALYMMLTRSFIRTYFILPSGYIDKKLIGIEAGLKSINEKGAMVIDAPSKEEQQLINTRIEYDSDRKSLNDIVRSVFEELDVPPLWHNPIWTFINVDDEAQLDYDKIKEIVEKAKDLMAIRNDF